MCQEREGEHGGPPHRHGFHGGTPPEPGFHCGPPPWFGFRFEHGFDHHHFKHRFFHQMQKMWAPFVPYDLEETNIEYIITMPLPGFDISEIDVSVKENSIYVEAQKPEAPETPTEPQPRKLWSLGDFLWNRSHMAVKIALPETIDPDSVKAKLAKGILTITVEKIPGTKVPVGT